MFPASAGMNRRDSSEGFKSQHVPRERGDEPDIRKIWNQFEGMFPASAGMNRTLRMTRHPIPHVPRERGDEPSLRSGAQPQTPCSPRARG